MSYVPKPGDLVLIRGATFFGELIEWAENGEYAHVALYAGNGQILEANGHRRTGYAPLSKYAGEYDIGRIEATDAQRMQALAYAESKIGTRYAWGLIVSIVLKLVFHINRPYQSKTAFICSSYVVEAWRSAGKLLTRADKPTPQDLAESPRVSIRSP